MQDKDRIIIVFYLDISRINSADVVEYTHAFAKSFNGYFDDSVKALYVPINGESHIECINPVLLNEEQYENVHKRVEEYENEFKKWQNEHETTNKQTD